MARGLRQVVGRVAERARVAHPDVDRVHGAQGDDAGEEVFRRINGQLEHAPLAHHHLAEVAKEQAAGRHLVGRHGPIADALAVEHVARPERRIRAGEALTRHQQFGGQRVRHIAAALGQRVGDRQVRLRVEQQRVGDRRAGEGADAAGVDDAGGLARGARAVQAGLVDCQRSLIARVL